MSDGDERLFAVAEVAAAWHVDESTAIEWIASGRVRAVTDADGIPWVPLGEVARWQGVLGQNRMLPTVGSAQPTVCGHTKYVGCPPCEHSVAAALADALAICAGWGLTTAETDALVRQDSDRAAAVIRIADLLDMYSPPLPQMWMTIPSKNARLGGTANAPVRPVDHAAAAKEGLWDVLRLLEGHAQGK